MERFSAEALLLDVTDLQEGDRIVAFLTREHGQKRGVARGARRKYSRFSGQLQPLARVRINWFEKAGRELVRITDVELEQGAGDFRDDLETLLLTSYLAEHTRAFVQENEPGEYYFRLLSSTLEALRLDVPRSLAARYFETWALRLAGIFPPPAECPHCGEPFRAGAVLPPDGEALLCDGCAGNLPGGFAIGPETVVFLLRTTHEPLRRLAAEAPPSAGVLERVEELCARIRRAFLGHELRSYEMMRRTLSGLPGGPESPDGAGPADG